MYAMVLPHCVMVPKDCGVGVQVLWNVSKEYHEALWSCKMVRSYIRRFTIDTCTIAKRTARYIYDDVDLRKFV